MNLGAGEVIFILVFALIVFGPRRLPDIGRTVGKALGELRRATNDLKAGFTEGFDDLGDPLFLHGPTKTVKRWEPDKPAAAPGEPFPADPAAPLEPSGHGGSSAGSSGASSGPSSAGPSGDDGAGPR